jgi:hypothetical protein
MSSPSLTSLPSQQGRAPGAGTTTARTANAPATGRARLFARETEYIELADDEAPSEFNAVRAAYPHISRSGSITLVSGLAGQRARPERGIYAGVLGGVEGMVKSLPPSRGRSGSTGFAPASSIPSFHHCTLHALGFGEEALVKASSMHASSCFAPAGVMLGEPSLVRHPSPVVSLNRRRKTCCALSPRRRFAEVAVGYRRSASTTHHHPNRDRRTPSLARPEPRYKFVGRRRRPRGRTD